MFWISRFGFAAKQVSEPSWHITTIVVRLPQPSTVTTTEPWIAGWMKSSESNTAGAFVQPRSKRPRRSAVSIAVGYCAPCLCSEV